MKKVIILIPIGAFYPAKTGGPSLTMFWHVNALDNSKFHSSVISTSTGLNPDYSTINSKQFTIYGDLFFCRTRIHYLPIRLIYQAIVLLRKSDIIHLTSINYPPSLIIAFIGLLSKKKIVWSVRGGLEEGALKSGSKFIKGILNCILRFFSSKNIWYHATSENERNQINRILKPKNIPILIPNYIVLNRQLEVKEKKEKFFFYLGRIDPIKSIDTFLIASSTSKLFRESEFCIKIAGDNANSYGNYLRLLINDLNLNTKVEFVGRVSGLKKQKLLSTAYCLFLPSKSENFGNVVIESLVSSTPVIVSNATPWEILNKKGAGYWIERTPKRMQQSLEDIISLSPENYNQMCRNAKLVGDGFDIKFGIKNWETSYENILAT